MVRGSNWDQLVCQRNLLRQRHDQLVAEVYQHQTRRCHHNNYGWLDHGAVENHFICRLSP